MIRMKKPKAILLDIEGTTTSVDYYPSSVSPYIRNNLESYVKAHWGEEHVQSIVKDLRQQAFNQDVPKILDDDRAQIEVQRSVLIHIDFLLRNNITTIAMLYLQMYVWIDGQARGVLKTHVFKDVAEMMYRWRIEDRISIYIYSSARADVQMLMFSCTIYGSLLQLIDGHFDSKIGAKTTPDTYHRIAQSIAVAPANIVFFTDDAKEARSAKNVGFKVILVRREKKTYLPADVAQFDIITTFSKIKFDEIV